MRRTLAILASMIIAVALLGACSSGSDKPEAAPKPIDMRNKTSVEIDAKGNQWVPPNILIDQGTEVTWKNDDSVAHNVKKSADAIDFGAPFGVEAGQFGPGDTYSFTFDKPGDYPFVCTIHAGMNGRITVGGPPGSTSTTTTVAGS